MCLGWWLMHSVLGEVRLGYRIPRNGTSISGRVEPEVELWVDDHRAFISQFGEVARLCCEVDGHSMGCERLESTQLRMGNLAVGRHEIRCRLINIADGSDLLDPCCSSSSNFRVVASAAETEDGARLLQLRDEEQQVSIDLLAWWQGGPEPAYFAALQRPISQNPLLVVGVKCAAPNIIARDAMRRTWLRSSPELIGRFAIGSAPDHSSALAREHAVFGDMLLDELHIEDGYKKLVDKTKAFLTYFVIHFSSTPFVMLVDDDVYVDSSKLVESARSPATMPRLRFYGGQVWADHFGQPKLPQRDPVHRNYLSEDEYPMSQLPPFAIGPHYLLSRDCAKFVATNSAQLQGVGTLEDVSMAMWMFAIGVKPQHTDLFANARLFGCVSHAVSLADLTPAAIRAIHDNRLHERDPCHGYDELKWVKTPRFKFTVDSSAVAPVQASEPKAVHYLLEGISGETSLGRTAA